MKEWHGDEPTGYTVMNPICLWLSPSLVPEMNSQTVMNPTFLWLSPSPSTWNKSYTVKNPTCLWLSPSPWVFLCGIKQVHSDELYSVLQILLLYMTVQFKIDSARSAKPLYVYIPFLSFVNVTFKIASMFKKNYNPRWHTYTAMDLKLTLAAPSLFFSFKIIPTSFITKFTISATKKK